MNLENDVLNTTRFFTNIVTYFTTQVKDQVRMIDDYDRKITDLRNKFTNEVSNLGEKLVNEVDRNMKLEEHIKQLQKHLADLDGERREILTKYDAVSVNEQEFVRDMEDLEDKYKVCILACYSNYFVITEWLLDFVGGIIKILLYDILLFTF